MRSLRSLLSRIAVMIGLCRSRAACGAALMAAVAFAIGSGAANAQPCPHRGDLDARYCDADQDLLADAPRDQIRLRDPATIYFSYTPADDPSIYESKFAGLIAHLSKVTGKPVRWYPAESYATQIERMRSGRLHIAGVGGSSAPFVVNLAGFVPLVAIERHDGTTGYALQFVTADDSTIARLSDIRGRRIAHVSPSSWSGDTAPRLLLEAKGIVPGKDYIVRFSGKHENSVAGVVSRDFDGAIVASTVIERMLQRGQLAPGRLRVVHSWQPFPRTAFGVTHDLDPKLRERVRQAFLSFDFARSSLAAEFRDSKGFASIDYRRDWADLRTVQKAAGVTYTPDELTKLRR
jgi:phosphonate transport system substrate-binding protein